MKVETSGVHEMPDYDATTDAVVLATCAGVSECVVRAWLEGRSVDHAAALSLAKARESVRRLVSSPEFAEVLEEVRRFRRIPVARRWPAIDRITAFDLSLSEAVKRGVA